MSTTDSLNEIPDLDDVDDLVDEVDDLADDYLDDEEPEGSGRAWNGPGRPSARRDHRDDRHQDDDLDEDDVVEAGAVVAMLLDRVEAADRLDRADVADLALLLGSRWAQRLARTLNAEFAQAARSRPGRAFLHGLLSAGRPGASARQRSTSSEPVSAVLLQIEVGKRLTRAERDRLARAAGRHGARVLEDEIRDAAGPRGGWGR